ncbi:MAG: hypothetical protein NTY09_15520 [bacterium]|nr:hypothetical protein [bacterium]
MPIILIIAVVYVGIGVWAMTWIKTDNLFRMSEIADILAYGSVILWPVTIIAWLAARPPEKLEDLAAKKSHQDFKNFMKQRGVKDFDLDASLKKYAKKTSSDKPYEIAEAEVDFRDYHLEDLINQKEWMDALRTANDMLRFAREQQEDARVVAYDRYIREIKDKRRDDAL